ncbi:hypothetical protein PVAP13_9KG417159 [Panicum virgatum]|uniref:Uncharacterized protein n=1 Tax=Panicum virgatum TaxID=38727 RepID=A0A8T0NDZ8_PANVG|nr:hypothetical protein PVAP13_9KG417159 [Panicum virgatum]
MFTFLYVKAPRLRRKPLVHDSKNQWSTRFTSNGWRHCFHHAGFLVCSNLLGSSRPLSFPVPRALSSLFAFSLSPSVFSLSLPLIGKLLPSACPPPPRPPFLDLAPSVHAPWSCNVVMMMAIRTCN